ARVRAVSCGVTPNTSVTFGLSLTSGTCWRFVRNVTRAPGHFVRIARSKGVVSRTSPIALNRTTNTSGERKMLYGPGGASRRGREPHVPHPLFGGAGVRRGDDRARR